MLLKSTDANQRIKINNMPQSTNLILVFIPVRMWLRGGEVSLPGELALSLLARPRALFLLPSDFGVPLVGGVPYYH